MPHSQSTYRRWSTAARWPLGVLLAGWRYLWSTTPVNRWEMSGAWPADAPPPLPTELDDGEVQRLEDGVGPMLRRIYRTRIVGSPLTPEELMGVLCADLDRVAPSEFATFQKLGGGGPLHRGDEYLVRMPGPWDGPVRVVATGPTAFRLATLQGHLEAGQIEFRVGWEQRRLIFEIESWARSGDRLSHLLYTHLRVSKETQLHMWTSVLQAVVALSRGKMWQGIVTTTRSVDEADLPWVERGGREGNGKDPHLAALAGRGANFDLAELEGRIDPDRWQADYVVEPLPHEAPGPPREGGSWKVARRIMDSYQLADPRIVSGTYDRDSPLRGRDILLRVRFGPLLFRAGVRIGEAYEETVNLDGSEVMVGGWSYHTLEGHFEEGRMAYELWKWLDSGDVEFHLHAVSRPARRGPLLRRTGFRLFGRSQQLRFYRQISRRLRRLTEAQLEAERSAASAPSLR